MSREALIAPLQGKKVVITRPLEQAGELQLLIEEKGGIPLLFPVIQTKEVVDKEVEQITDQLASYDVLLLTSVNAVKYMFAQLERYFPRTTLVDLLSTKHLAVIGTKTAKYLEEYGLSTDLVPDKFKQEEMTQLLLQHFGQGAKLLYPKARETREYLLQHVQEAGFLLTEWTVYETVKADTDPESLLQAIQPGEEWVLTFTSSSTVRYFQEIVGWEKLQAYREQLVVACIGPITADTAKELGFNVDVSATVYTAAGLVEGLENYLQNR